ncbi:type II toxin-antitoxin system RelE/ParE family toxin [Caminibacter sp.]
MQIIFSKSFERDYKKLIKNNKNLKEKIDFTIELFKKDYKNQKLNFKHIICKKDKYRYSIRVINTQYRILMTCIDNICEFRFLLDHDEYDRKNKDC